MNDLSCQLLVLGAGPGGYVCALRAAQLGLDTIVVESRSAGGTCLNEGCIPSKALIHAAQEYELLHRAATGQSPLGISATAPEIDFAATVGWKDGIVGRLRNGVAGLFKKNGVRLVSGTAAFLDGKTVSVTPDNLNDNASAIKIRAENVVIATGSEVQEIPDLPFGGAVVSSAQALSLDQIPARLAVVGAGYIGLELGIAFAKFGSVVTVVESADTILPQYDAELSSPVRDRLKSLDVDLRLQTLATGWDTERSVLQLSADGAVSDEIEVDKVLVAVGRRARMTGWGAEKLLLDTTDGCIKIDDQCQTSMRGIYAIGDVTGDPMLAHRAMAQGELVAEVVAGSARRWDKHCIPAVCFTDPEIVCAGLSAQQALQSGIDVVTGKFPFVANGRALTAGRSDGFIRIVARSSDHVVLGVQGVGEGISEISAAAALAIEMGARLEDVAATIHAHPTRGESLLEAALAALDRPLHSH